MLLPCEFGRAPRLLLAAIRRLKPVVVISLGEARGRREVMPELRALNRDAARIPDNAGRQPRFRRIVRRGPLAHPSTLPVDKIVSVLRREGIPAALSRDAGGYVCNHLFFRLMHGLHRQPGLKMPAGFIHLPVLNGGSAIPLRRQIRAVRLAIETALQSAQHTDRVGGAAPRAHSARRPRKPGSAYISRNT